jgi:hypothetical protein
MHQTCCLTPGILHLLLMLAFAADMAPLAALCCCCCCCWICSRRDWLSEAAPPRGSEALKACTWVDPCVWFRELAPPPPPWGPAGAGSASHIHMQVIGDIQASSYPH